MFRTVRRSLAASTVATGVVVLAGAALAVGAHRDRPAGGAGRSAGDGRVRRRARLLESRHDRDGHQAARRDHRRDGDQGGLDGRAWPTASCASPTAILDHHDQRTRSTITLHRADHAGLRQLPDGADAAATPSSRGSTRRSRVSPSRSTRHPRLEITQGPPTSDELTVPHRRRRRRRPRPPQRRRRHRRSPPTTAAPTTAAATTTAAPTTTAPPTTAAAATTGPPPSPPPPRPPRRPRPRSWSRRRTAPDDDDERQQHRLVDRRDRRRRR